MSEQKYKELESTTTLDQSRTIAEALNAHGIKADLVENKLGEPLAVIARGALELDKVVGSLSLKDLWNPDIYQGDEITAVRNGLPIGGATLYPKSFLDIIDTAAKAATGDSEVLATDFKSRTRTDDDWRLPTGRGLGLHIDFPSNADNLFADEALAGLNFHVTREGEALVSLGMLRSLRDHENFFKGSQSDYDKQVLLKELGAPFTDIALGPGDVLIFQAQQRTNKGLLPIAHDFVTTSEERISDVYAPQVRPAAEIQAQRDELVARHRLQDSGYTSQPPKVA